MALIVKHTQNMDIEKAREILAESGPEAMYKSAICVITRARNVF